MKLEGFDANTVEPNEGFPVLPAGEYDVVITSSERKPTKNGQGFYLNLELQVLNGEFQNQKLFDKLNLENQNATAVQIAKGTLSAICRAVGVLTPKDSSELHNKPLRARVQIRDDPEYGKQNVIKGYKAANGAPAQQQPAAAAANGKPW